MTNEQVAQKLGLGLEGLGVRIKTPALKPAGLPSDMRLDPDFEQEPGHAALGFWRVIRDDGLRTVWQERGSLPCPVCAGDPEKTPDCAECVGRGVVTHIPFTNSPWDQIIPFLYVGGHDTQAEEQVHVTREDGFKLVVSLYRRFGNDIPPGITHRFHRMEDADLNPLHHGVLDELADAVAEKVRDGKKVLVRCQAGLNRSALVAALAMLKLGFYADEAIALIRERRSPYALCNESFVDYLHQKGNINR